MGNGPSAVRADGTFLSLLPGHKLEARGVHAADVTSSFGRSRFWIIGRKDRRTDPTVRAVVAQLTSRRAR